MTDSAPATTMTSALVGRIRSDIVEGVFAPGSKLVIKELCERYGTSLIPMREALSRLTSSGFVVAQDQRGFKVASASADDLLDIARARILIECEALKLSLQQGDLAWEGRVLAAHHQLARLTAQYAGTGDQLWQQWDDAHMAFHDALLSACHAPVLLELAANLRERSTRYRHISVVADGKLPGGPKQRGRARDIVAEHKELVDVALARDVDRACELLRSHFQQTADRAIQRMQSLHAKALAQPPQRRRA